MYYKKKHILVVDVDANQHDFTYYKGAIFVRTNNQVQLMNSSDIKAADGKFINHTSSPYEAIERMNIQNAGLQDQVLKLEGKIDQHHTWEVGADKKSFKWAVFFCVAGSVPGAIIGTVLGKIFI